MTTLRTRYAAAIEAAISKAKASRDLVTVPAFDGAEAYAYPKPGNRIGWGINAAQTGVNVLGGIRRPNQPSRGKSGLQPPVITFWRVTA